MIMAIHLAETSPSYAVFNINPRTGERAITAMAVADNPKNLRVYARRNLRHWRIDVWDRRIKSFVLFENQPRLNK
ncbi:MAG: hypothetical protein ACOYBQ_10345 [Fluviibacter sp.]